MREMQEPRVRSLGGEDPPEKEMAAHSSILGWKSHVQRSQQAAVHGLIKGRDSTGQTEYAPTHQLVL